jgi:DtxR family Mn-dependent transcriptional regulator|tara:strand:+ start:272 stop:781 length:510 start_codon:yes stop_codon:yes gene_type:complete
MAVEWAMEKEQSASMEDYLEAIALLSERNNEVRVTEISRTLGVKKPSVTSALTKLAQGGLLKHERYGQAKLTTKGQRIAQDVFHRHETLRHFLTEILKVDPKVATNDACKMEHTVSPATLEKLAKFVEFVLNRPQGEPDWLKNFSYYFENDEFPSECVTRCQRETSQKE